MGLNMKLRVRSGKLYEPLGEHVAGAMQSRGGEIQAERKLSGWLLVLPYWGFRTGGELHWSWSKKLRQINMDSRTKRVRPPLPCEIFIGGGYVFQEAKQRGGQ